MKVFIKIFYLFSSKLGGYYMDLTIHIIGIAIFVGIVLSVIWSCTLLRLLLIRFNKFCDEPFYDENKHPFEDWDALNHKYGPIIQNIIVFMPLLAIFVILYFVFNRIEYIQTIFAMLLMVFIPLSIMELRSNVFTHNKKQILSNGVVKSVVFTGEGYPINIVGLASMFNMWCCVLFGLGNYFQNYHTRFLVLAFICLLFELMFLFIDYVDRVIPLNLKSSSGFFTYATIILSLAFTLSLRFYSWTSWV